MILWLFTLSRCYRQPDFRYRGTALRNSRRNYLVRWLRAPESSCETDYGSGFMSGIGVISPFHVVPNNRGLLEIPIAAGA